MTQEHARTTCFYCDEGIPPSSEHIVLPDRTTLHLECCLDLAHRLADQDAESDDILVGS